MKQPTTCVVVNAQGLALLPHLMRYVASCVACLKGSQYASETFWITRTDIYHDYIARGLDAEVRLSEDPVFRHLGEERFHEPSADLYHRDDHSTPIGRIINIEIPEVR